MPCFQKPKKPEARPPKKLSKSRTIPGTKGARTGKKQDAPSIPLEDMFPNIFTWVTEPKESSVITIKKYIAKHFGNELNVEKKFASAILRGESKRQLRRITGHGMTGTFQLIDGADKTGTLFEDAIEDAIIAMNEPKEASVGKLRDYMHEWHPEYNVTENPMRLLKALERSESKGHLVRVSGKGFSGSFRLSFPYYPGPKELWGM